MNITARKLFLLAPVLFIACQMVDDKERPSEKDGQQMSQGSEAVRNNLIKNPGFELIDVSSDLPEGWQVKSPRQELMPSYEADSKVSHSGKYSVKLSGRGNPGTFGYWVTTLPDLNTGPGVKNLNDFPKTVGDSVFLGSKSYEVVCFAKTKDIESPDKNIWIRVNWSDSNGKNVFTNFITKHRDEGDWLRFGQVIKMPSAAVSMNIELAVQWTAAGSVWFDDVSVAEVPSAKPRKIRAATVFARPQGPTTPEKNLEHFAALVEEAGKLNADIICLGEGITVVSTGKTFEEIAETIPGPASTIIGEAARKSKMYVVAGIYEKDGPVIYNTALLFDRQGNVAGKYRKTHLPQTEVLGGLTPGTEYPVFKTDFGTVGIQICYDYFFPEVTRNLALQGAEIILVPIWGDGRDERRSFEIMARSRAIDYSVFFITSIYSNPRSLIINPDGKVLAFADSENKIAVADINLDEQSFEKWLSVSGFGEWKSFFVRERRPETYNISPAME